MFRRPEDDVIAKFALNHGPSSDIYGWSVALSANGKKALFGVYYSDVTDILDTGVVYVYARRGNKWEKEGKLKIRDDICTDSFGVSCAINKDGTLAAVSAVSSDYEITKQAGAIFIFQQTSNLRWEQTHKISIKREDTTDLFGGSIALSADGKTLVVGAKFTRVGDKKSAGAIYVFEFIKGEWAHREKIIPNDPQENGCFGWSVSVNQDGTRIAIGAYGSSDGTTENGAVYVYDKISNHWTFHTKVVTDDKKDGDRFGFSLALSPEGDVLVGSSIFKTKDNGVKTGAVYVFIIKDHIWEQVSMLMSVPETPLGFLGSTIAVSKKGNHILVGAHGNNFNDEGKFYPSAYLFIRKGNTWHQAKAYTFEEYSGLDHFGTTVCITPDGNTGSIGLHDYNPSEGKTTPIQYVLSIK